MPDPVHSAERLIWRDGRLGEGARLIPEETAIALTYNGGTYAVMMGTPRDLRDFAIGFSLSEGIVRSPDEIETLDIVELDDGIELRMWLTPSSAELVNERRRHIAGPTGCGICGVESIAEAIRPAAVVPKGRTFTPSDIMTAMASIHSLQQLNIQTRAVHAAAFWTPAHGLVALREDVGRHNALDKLIGARLRGGQGLADGFALVTSRASYEMVQKAATLGIRMLVAVSAPTALGVELARDCGLTLVGFAREEQQVIYTHPERIRQD